jgi:hypothetical protein
MIKELLPCGLFLLAGNLKTFSRDTVVFNPCLRLLGSAESRAPESVLQKPNYGHCAETLTPQGGDQNGSLHFLLFFISIH